MLSLGRYTLVRKLATGGMAEIFLARQAGPSGFERTCVVKRMIASLAQEPQYVKMFLDEAQLTAQLSHPNIAQVFDFGEQEGSFFLAMEYVPGTDLRFLIESRAPRKNFLPFALAARLISQAANALQYAHTATDGSGTPLHVIHRDVSPQNILLSNTGAVKLIDFGVAKAEGARQRTQTGFIKGTFAYMSPEQVLGEKLDRRSDLFSLGLVFYELLALRPAVGSSDAPAMEEILNLRFTPIEQLRPDVPRPLAVALGTLLRRRREERFSAAGELAQVLERWITESGAPVTPAQLAELAAAANPSIKQTMLDASRQWGVELDPTLVALDRPTIEVAPGRLMDMLGDSSLPPTTLERVGNTPPAPAVFGGVTLPPGVRSWADTPAVPIRSPAVRLGAIPRDAPSEKVTEPEKREQVFSVDRTEETPPARRPPILVYLLAALVCAGLGVASSWLWQRHLARSPSPPATTSAPR